MSDSPRMSPSSVDAEVAWPTFLGIGVPRAGSTWLYRLMESHPAIWVPPQRTEVHFFDRYFDRGFDWYAQFFPRASPLVRGWQPAAPAAA